MRRARAVAPRRSLEPPNSEIPAALTGGSFNILEGRIRSHGSPTEAGSDRLLRVTTFDTLTAARALEDAGMDAKQAAAVTTTIRSAVAEGVAIRADIADLRTELAAMEARLTWRMVLIAGAVTALVTALDRLLG